MRQKMLAISQRLRKAANDKNPNLMSPKEILIEIADCIDEELEGGEFTRCMHPVHSNPGLVAPCPECGADPYAKSA